MTLLHSSSRRPPSLKAQDYDHRISLVDSEREVSTSPARPASTAPYANERVDSPELLSSSPSRQDSLTSLRKKTSLRRYVIQGKQSTQEENPNQLEAGREHNGTAQLGEAAAPVTDPDSSDGEVRGRPRSKSRKEPHKKDNDPEGVIDILYENQRGGYFCGCLPLFSAKALGNLDPPPWTNLNQKASPTDIYNAQVPDPSWKWAWKEWTINKDVGVDEEGWEYSFMFSKKFSWHGPTWWNSFVRRRVWTRRRVKASPLEGVTEGHALNPDYFTIHNYHRSRSRASKADSAKKRSSAGTLSRIGANNGDENPLEGDIRDIPNLMVALKSSRIDREKMEAVVNFIQNSGEELYYIRDRMADIMHLFIFQASRRLLLAHLLHILDEAADEHKKTLEDQTEPDPVKQRRIENLEAALKSADEEVRRLEFWSDVKEMAESGETKGAVGESGWREGWVGADNSGPKDVITNRSLPGKADCEENDCTGDIAAPALKEKGKEKATE